MREIVVVATDDAEFSQPVIAGSQPMQACLMMGRAVW